MVHVCGSISHYSFIYLPPPLPPLPLPYCDYLWWCKVMVSCLPSEMRPKLWSLQTLCQLCGVAEVGGRGGGRGGVREEGKRIEGGQERWWREGGKRMERGREER